MTLILAKIAAWASLGAALAASVVWSAVLGVLFVVGLTVVVGLLWPGFCIMSLARGRR